MHRERNSLQPDDVEIRLRLIDLILDPDGLIIHLHAVYGSHVFLPVHSSFVRNRPFPIPAREGLMILCPQALPSRLLRFQPRSICTSLPPAVSVRVVFLSIGFRPVLSTAAFLILLTKQRPAEVMEPMGPFESLQQTLQLRDRSSIEDVEGDQILVLPLCAHVVDPGVLRQPERLQYSDVSWQEGIPPLYLRRADAVLRSLIHEQLEGADAEARVDALVCPAGRAPFQLLRVILVGVGNHPCRVERVEDFTLDGGEALGRDL
mmetsp:Transcript_45830/g.143784  ORF Transcript_45830/g.143784 Transcript_45830/m.143784 type:complete len:262 (-) Transcript_45830:105-890(-)